MPRLQYLMYKDIPVLEIKDFNTKILDFGHLPYALRYPDVNYDDIFHGWTENRLMSVGKTNAKKILSALNASPHNLYALAKALHFASITDCYWIKENEDTPWKDVSLFKNPYSDGVSEVALFGTDKRLHIPLDKLHTPELTAQGVAAKAWIWEKDGLYLYKVGKMEAPASQILDALHVSHIPYTIVNNEKLAEISSENRISKIREAEEQVVKCKCICNETLSIVSWEDFLVYCDRNDIDAFKFVKEKFPEEYFSMNVVDYVLGNWDRHTENWGFLMDNENGQITSLHPLMDHDNAFSNEPFFCQTWETETMQKDAAKNAIKYCHIDLSPLGAIKKPEMLTEKQWGGVLERGKELQKEIPFKDQLSRTAFAMGMDDRKESGKDVEKAEP